MYSSYVQLVRCRDKLPRCRENFQKIYKFAKANKDFEPEKTRKKNSV